MRRFPGSQPGFPNSQVPSQFPFPPVLCFMQVSAFQMSLIAQKILDGTEGSCKEIFISLPCPRPAATVAIFQSEKTWRGSLPTCPEHSAPPPFAFPSSSAYHFVFLIRAPAALSSSFPQPDLCLKMTVYHSVNKTEY